MQKERKICKICGSDMEQVQSYNIELKDWQGFEIWKLFYECFGPMKHIETIYIIEKQLPDHHEIVSLLLNNKQYDLEDDDGE